MQTCRNCMITVADWAIIEAESVHAMGGPACFGIGKTLLSCSSLCLPLPEAVLIWSTAGWLAGLSTHAHS